LFKKTAALVLLANVAVMAAGCAKGVMPTAPQMKGAAGIPTIMTKGGKEFALGFDDARYKQVEKKTKVRKLPRQALLPTRADVSELCSPVANQSKLGACTAFAVGKGFREFQINKRNERKVPLSAMYLYYEARALWGNTQEPTGSTITDNISVLEDKGMATDATMPYDITKYMIAPTAAAHAEAKEFKYTGAVRVGSMDDVQAALAKGEPVLFAFDVMQSFRSIGPDGVMPVPQAGEKRLGGHAVMAVGYDNQKQLVKVRNSWGADWADHGYFYMPYSVFKSTARDIWTAGTVAR
jgi:C1A family cysteine protease